MFHKHKIAIDPCIRITYLGSNYRLNDTSIFYTQRDFVLEPKTSLALKTLSQNLENMGMFKMTNTCEYFA